MKLWTYLEYAGCSTGGLTVLHGRKGKQMTGSSKEWSNLGDYLLIMSCSLCIPSSINDLPCPNGASASNQPCQRL